MGDAAGAEEAFLAGKGPVDKLIDEHEIARCHLFAERPAGGDRDKIGHTQPLQRVDIGAVGHRGGGVDMAAPVTRQEGHFDAIQMPRQHRVGGGAEGAVDPDPLRAFQPLDLIDARAAEYADHALHDPHSPGRCIEKSSVTLVKSR